MARRASTAQSASSRGRVQSGWQSVRRARYSAAAPRYLATAILFGFFAIGLRTAFFPPPRRRPGDPVSRGADAPSEDFALQFARAYLSYDAERPGERAPGAGALQLQPARRRRRFHPCRRLPAGALGRGRLRPAGAGRRAGDHRRRPGLQPAPALVSGGKRPPRAGQALELVGYPSLVGAPAVNTRASPPARSAVTEPAVAEVVDRVLRNYLAGAAPNLKADLTADAAVTLPTLRLRVQSFGQMAWVAGPGSGAVLATVSRRATLAATPTRSPTNWGSPTASAPTSTSSRSCRPRADRRPQPKGR